MNETPDTVHGRLLESAHLSGYSFDRACSELEWLLDDNRWQRVGQGYTNINEFLKTIDLSEFQLAVEQRKSLAKKLQKLQASARTTARLIGVDEGTIRLDLGQKQQRADKSAEEAAHQVKTLGKQNPHADKSAAWFQADVDPAAAAKLNAARRARDEEREARREDSRAKIATLDNAKIALSAAVKFATIVADPPWDWNDEGDVDQFGCVRPEYATMPYEALLQYPVVEFADVDAHLYLWITNRSLPKGFALLEVWGFRYVTCLTWCKPSIGIGNYFRGSTEQVLFGVKGSQPLKRKDVGTWFTAPRSGHSAKPESFYQLVEACSPGPYLDLFGRSSRAGWTIWGENGKAEMG